MELRELIIKVEEQTLGREQLEGYRDQLVKLFGLLKLEQADLEKLEALYMNAKEDGQSVVDRRWAWKASDKGQRLIEIDIYDKI